MSYAPTTHDGFAPPPEMNMDFQPRVMPQSTSYAMHHSNHSYQPQYGNPYPPNSEYPPPPSYDPQDGYQCPSNSGSKSDVVTSQPIGADVPVKNDDWMSIPQTQLIPNCPPGLEYLTAIDQLLVHQKVELLEALTEFETKNKYTIKNTLGQKVYWAVEESNCCCRMFCGRGRSFQMKILDMMKNEVIHLNRSMPLCLSSMEVSAPPGNVIGSIQQEWSLCYPSFAIKNHLNETVLRIEAPNVCAIHLCGEIDFKIVNMNGDKIGKISKQWSGLIREIFTDADHFGINFPMDLDVQLKAVLIGACFLIDFLFYEKGSVLESLA